MSYQWFLSRVPRSNCCSSRVRPIAGRHSYPLCLSGLSHNEGTSAGTDAVLRQVKRFKIRENGNPKTYFFFFITIHKHNTRPNNVTPMAIIFSGGGRRESMVLPRLAGSSARRVTPTTTERRRRQLHRSHRYLSAVSYCCATTINIKKWTELGKR